MKPLIVCFSQTGKTKKLCGCMAKSLDADFVELKEIARRGLIGAYTLGVYDAIRRKSGDILPVDTDISEYDTLVVASPVWAGNVTPAVNDFIREYDLSGKTVYGFITHAGGAGEAANLLRTELEQAGAVCPQVLDLQATRELIYDVKAERKAFRLTSDGKLELSEQDGEKKE
ncbi:flavodoxin family protein [Clostridium merdae]|uniref:flavodoxin family protein n=1 Tax=Clostridium merdae TaxID=1958780 RepID=UPI000A272715|nr:NAD(P)H-dependent oxidoreductase [Clostridium merdae]